MVPSVAMNGSIRPTVVIRPLASPQVAPIATATTMPASSMVSGSPIAPLLRNRIIRLATKAVIAPTERSRPPAEMTKVAPTPMIAVKAARVSTLTMLPTVKKLSLTNEPTTRRMKSATNGAIAAMSTRPMLHFRGPLFAVVSVISAPRSLLPLPGS